jgi:DNA gyrase/topoisomerase IV subunit A
MDTLKSSWLIEGDIESDLHSRTFKINSISPLQRYESFFIRLNTILERKGLNYRMDNFSTDEVKISIKFRCTDQEFKEISDILSKETKQIVTENIVFVRDGSVLEYDAIEDYLNDFLVHRERTILKRYERDLLYLNNELEFLEAKLKFLIFMQEKKREAEEVNKFVGAYKKEISRRLESISLVKLTKEEIIKTKEEINLIKSDIKNKNSEIKSQREKVKAVEKESKMLSKKATSRTTSLLGDTKEEFHNGIRVFDPEEELIEEVEQENELNIENE